MHDVSRRVHIRFNCSGSISPYWVPRLSCSVTRHGLLAHRSQPSCFCLGTGGTVWTFTNRSNSSLQHQRLHNRGLALQPAQRRRAGHHPVPHCSRLQRGVQLQPAVVVEVPLAQDEASTRRSGSASSIAPQFEVASVPVDSASTARLHRALRALRQWSVNWSEALKLDTLRCVIGVDVAKRPDAEHSYLFFSLGTLLLHTNNSSMLPAVSASKCAQHCLNPLPICLRSI